MMLDCRALGIHVPTRSEDDTLEDDRSLLLDRWGDLMVPRDEYTAFNPVQMVYWIGNRKRRHMANR